jgi:hypothetical protein
MLRRPFESALAAMIGMMDHAARAALAEGHVEGLEDQLGTQRGLHRPTHDAPAEHIEHHGEIEKAGPGRDVADVGHPQTIWS